MFDNLINDIKGVKFNFFAIHGCTKLFILIDYHCVQYQIGIISINPTITHTMTTRYG